MVHRYNRDKIRDESNSPIEPSVILRYVLVWIDTAIETSIFLSENADSLRR